MTYEVPSWTHKREMGSSNAIKQGQWRAIYFWTRMESVTGLLMGSWLRAEGRRRGGDISLWLQMYIKFSHIDYYYYYFNVRKIEIKCKSYGFSQDTANNNIVISFGALGFVHLDHCRRDLTCWQIVKSSKTTYTYKTLYHFKMYSSYY